MYCHVFVGQGHEPWGISSGNAYMDSIVGATADFFYPMAAMSTLEGKTGSIQCFPNPASNRLAIIWDASMKPSHWQVVNAQGMECMKGSMFGVKRVDLMVGELSAGWYSFNMQCEGGTFRQSFIKR